MACTHPRIMAVADLNKFYSVGLVQRLEKQNWKIDKKKLIAYRLVSKDSRDDPLEDIPSWARLEDMEIPCGNCIQCRLDYSKSWATRCYLESLYYKHNYFVTLTYDDDHLLRSAETDNPTVWIADFRKFIKDLRNWFMNHMNHVGIKYFGCTEYGDQSFRPHGHLILFNCPIPDLQLDFIDDDGQVTRRSSSYGPMYFSKLIKSLWPYGFITIEDANYNTEAYVSRYIMKKQKGKAGIEVYQKMLDIEPPQLFMSLNIGQQYFEDHEKELIENPSLIVPRGDKEPLVSGIPRYFKKKILDRHPNKYDEMLNKAKENTLKSRSLLKGKQRINDNRAAKEDHTKRAFDAFSRNL